MIDFYAILRVSILISTAFLTLAADTPPGDCESPGDLNPAEAWLAHIRECLGSIRSIKGEFIQERIHPLGKQTLVSTGMLEARKRNMFRLSYSDPPGFYLASDGKSLWSYDPIQEVAYKSSINKSIMPQLLDLLSSDGESEDFSISHLGGDIELEQGSRAALEIRPTQVNPYVRSVVVTVNDTCPALEKVLIEEPNGTILRMTLRKLLVNPGITKRKFEVTPPKGTAIVNI